MSKKQQYAYSVDEELFNYESEDECIDHLLSNVLTDGEVAEMLSKGESVEFYRGVVVPHKSSDFADMWIVEDILENMNIRATDNCGESAEYFAVDGVTKEAKKQLEKYLKTWANKHLDCSFYGIKNIEKVVVKVTKDLLKEYDL